MILLNWFKVRFPSSCSDCRKHISEGDYVAYSKIYPGELLCVDCGKAEEGESE